MPNQKYEAFVTVAKTGSFKKTAEILGYTQAGVSYMMSSLEQEMGTALFTRDHSGAAPHGRRTQPPPLDTRRVRKRAGAADPPRRTSQR